MIILQFNGINFQILFVQLFESINFAQIQFFMNKKYTCLSSVDFDERNWILIIYPGGRSCSSIWCLL